MDNPSDSPRNQTDVDIGDLKRLENGIREGEAPYHFLAEAIPHLVWTAQPDGTIDYFNERCMIYTGCTREELFGWGWERVIHPDDFPLKLQLYHQAIESGTEFRHEYRIRRHDGQYRWHQGHAVPFRDEAGIIRRWYGTCTDVDALKQTEAARLRQEQERRYLMEAAHCLLWYADVYDTGHPD